MNEMGGSIGSGFDYPARVEEANYSFLYFILASLTFLLAIVPTFYLALADNPTTTDKWFAIGLTVASSFFTVLICVVGVKETVKETRRGSKA